MVYSLMVPSLLKVGFHILLLFLLFSFHVDRAMSTNDYIKSRCDYTTRYFHGDAFETNMQSVLSILTNNAPPDLFAEATAGEGSDRVYGLAQCRGDVNRDTCYTCISNSTEYLVNTYCPNAMDAIIWYENCQLRYSNTDFFGQLNVEDSGSWHWKNGEVVNPNAFYEKVGSLLKYISSTATTEPSSRFMFARGYIPYENHETIYGLVQCTKDTSLADCSWCLNNVATQLPDRCQEKGATTHGCEIATGSCRVRFDTEPFYTSTPTPIPSPNSALPSNSSVNPSPNSEPPSRPSPSLSTVSPNTASDKVNHSSVISVTVITVITFALTSTFLF